MNKFFQFVLSALALTFGLGASAQQTCNAAIPLSTPDTDFTNHVDGTVTHNRTGLMWKHCPEGQTWTGNACTGVPNTYTWKEALLNTHIASFAAYGDWRLPNIQELLSIVEEGCGSPAINTTVFPTTGGALFWSASDFVNSASVAWSIDFASGDASDYAKTTPYQVRLVRAGSAFGNFDARDKVQLSVTKTGAGTVSGGPINCGATCSATITKGLTVTLTASPAANLTAWGGACAGVTGATCTVTVDAAKTVTATFAQTALLTLSPGSLNFAPLTVGATSPMQTVTLTSTGGLALAISSITATGDFHVSNDCSSALGVGAFCTLSVSYTRTAGGASTGSVLVSSNAPGSPHSVTLSAAGVGKLSVVSPSNLDFGTQGVGTSSAAQTVTLSNTGGTTLTLASIVTFGDFTQTSDCGSTLASGAICSVWVRFAPLAAGFQIGSLQITSDASTSPNIVSLSGAGISVPLITLTPASLAFGYQVAGGGTGTGQSITLKNVGDATLSLAGISASGDFAVGSSSCGSGLVPGGSCTFSVYFAPTAIGARSAALTVSSNAVGSPHQASLSGTGQSRWAPICTLTPSAARVIKGRPVTLTATCTNASTSNYRWTGGGCTATTTSSCTDSPSATTTYGVTASNIYGTHTVSTTVQAQNLDLTPILMLLLD